MANNYLQFCSVLKMETKGREQEVEKIIKIGRAVWLKGSERYDDTFMEGLGIPGTRVEILEDGVLFEGEDSGEITFVEAVASVLQEAFKLDDPFIVEWACTHSKMRVDEFAGGAVGIWRGHQTKWVNPVEVIQDWVKTGGENAE